MGGLLKISNSSEENNCKKDHSFGYDLVLSVTLSQTLESIHHGCPYNKLTNLTALERRLQANLKSLNYVRNVKFTF